MVDAKQAAFILASIISVSDAIKCHVYFRKGKSAPKIDQIQDCASSSCCFTAQLHHNRQVFQIKGCDADSVQDDMLIYAPSLTGRPWENLMESCLASECRVYNDLLGGKGESYLCGCDTDFCNEKAFQATFPQLRSEDKNFTISGKSKLKINLLWKVSSSAIIIWGFS